MTIPLPDYPIALIRTGQFAFQRESIWQGAINPAAFGRFQEIESRLAGLPSAAVGGFNMYMYDGSLVYRKEPCAAVDTQAWFFMHLFPADINDLPPDRQRHGFINLGFDFPQHGAIRGGQCLAAVPLPGYEIALIRTGQFAFNGESIWQGEINPGALGRFQEIEAGLAGLPSAAAGGFELYWDGGSLVYRKEPCVAGDTEARFFLHLFPADVKDLPPDRQQYGFGNLGFDFPQYGAIRGGQCLAAVPLPGYEIARIRTGQYLPDGAQLWQADFSVGR